jgi:hypothetical protein
VPGLPTSRRLSVLATATIDGTWSVRESADQAIADGVAVYLYGDGAASMLVCERHGSGPCNHIEAVLREDEQRVPQGVRALWRRLLHRL